AQPIDLHVVRQGQVRALGDHQIGSAGDTAVAPEGADLVDQHGGVDHHPLTEDTGDAVSQDARRNQAGDVLHPVDDQRVSRVGAARPTDDVARLLGQEVDDLSLTFVAPLNTDDDYDCHDCLVLFEGETRLSIAT